MESLISDETNPTDAIDKFNEIVAFLNTIENTDDTENKKTYQFRFDKFLPYFQLLHKEFLHLNYF